MDFLAVSGVGKYHGKEQVLKEVSFVQKRFQKLAIAGETGSGKTTLMKMIAGIVQADSGNIFFENERIIGPDEKLMPGHAGISYLSQHFELRNSYRVEELLEYANTLTDEEAQNIYRICRIDHLLKRRTDQLSGGERQRIALARLLTAAPKLLLLDEPFSNLDTGHKNILKGVINDLSEKLHITCMLISHDPVDVLSWADEVIVLQNGSIIQKGTPGQVYAQPKNPYVAGLFGPYTSLSHPLLNKVSPANENELLLRPEYFKVVHEEEGLFDGTIKKIIFLGSHYHIYIAALDTIIIVQHQTYNLHVGDKVFVSITKYV